MQRVRVKIGESFSAHVMMWMMESVCGLESVFDGVLMHCQFIRGDLFGSCVIYV